MGLRQSGQPLRRCSWALFKDCLRPNRFSLHSGDLKSFLFWRLSIRYPSCIFHSCIFHPCYLLLHFPLLHFPLPRFQRPPENRQICLLLLDLTSPLGVANGTGVILIRHCTWGLSTLSVRQVLLPYTGWFLLYVCWRRRTKRRRWKDPRQHNSA